MTTRALLIVPFTLLAAPLIVAQSATPPPPTPPPVARALPLPQETAPAPAQQRLYSAGAETLIAPDAAQNVVGKFRTAYAAASAPRVRGSAAPSQPSFEAAIEFAEVWPIGVTRVCPIARNASRVPCGKPCSIRT